MDQTDGMDMTVQRSDRAQSRGDLFAIRGLSLARSTGPGYALRIPSLRIRAGEKIAITGPSGCGKSTALDILGMALKPDSAEEFLFAPAGLTRSVDVAGAWRKGAQNRLAALRLQHMGYVLQTGGLLPFLNVYENMELAARTLALPQRKERIEHMAERLGIGRLLRSLPGQLSVGERQRVAIGRALATLPDVILADEPTASLDPYHARAVMDIFLGMVEEAGTTLILVTHAPEIVRQAKLKEISMRLEALEDGMVNAVLEN